MWSIEQSEWTCKIDEGSAGLVDIRWSPDSRHILTTADFHLRITVWSLVNKGVSYIKHPKACPQGVDFTADGRYLAVAERRDCKDYVSIFDAISWQLVKHVDPETDDLAGVQWSPSARVLCIWESCLTYKVLFFSLEGHCLATYCAYDLALGIKCVAWSSTSQFVAIGSYDEKLRILNNLTWKSITELSHPATIGNANVLVYREMPKAAQMLATKTAPTMQSAGGSTHYEIVQGNVSVPVVKPDSNKANPRMGVGSASFSNGSRYLYTKNENMPTALWIWDVTKLKQTALLLQDAPIRAVSWDPVHSRLALCTGSNNLYMWSPSGTLSVQIPGDTSFNVLDLKWHPKGKCLVLINRDQMCVCFIASENGNDEPSASAKEGGDRAL